MYRSNRFLPILTAALEGFEYPNLEFIVSDRHHEDDAIERLREHFGADRRFRFMIAEDAIDWVSHYNLLLREATGDYFLWVSHDDSYSPGYIAELAKALDDNPAAIAAHGRVERITLGGERLLSPPPPPPGYGRRPNPLRAYRIMLSKLHVFHGMFRRRMLVDRQLWIRPTAANIGADALWIYTVALLGEVQFTGACTFTKRYYPSSTHKLWDGLMRPRYVLDLARVTDSYLDDYAPTKVQWLAGKAIAWLGCGLWYLRVSVRIWRRRLRNGALSRA